MTRRVLILFFSLAVFCLQASAQTVDDIVKKSIDARGGIQKIKAVKTLKATAKVIPTGLGQEIPIVILQKRPNAARIEVTFQGKSQIQAYDGETAWKID